MVGGIRADWFTCLVRECQVFIGEAVLRSDRPLRQVLATFAERVPPSATAIESLVLRGILVDVTLRWAEAHHRTFHISSTKVGCTFKPAELTSQIWRSTAGDALQILTRWASGYTLEFERAHPLSRAEELRRYLDRHFAEPMRVESLAKERHTPVRRMQRDFRTLTGRTIQEYVAERRVAAAVYLLETTTDKVEWIAKTVGWSSRKNLNRALSRARGVTPQDVRHPRATTGRRQAKAPSERSKVADQARERTHGRGR